MNKLPGLPRSCQGARAAITGFALLILMAGSAHADTAVASASTSSASQLSPRIIGGRVSTGEWPSVGALLFNAIGRPVASRQFCGATLIAPTWVLTAAHCVVREDGSTRDAFNLSVMFGELDLTVANGAPELLVQNVIVHPAYDLPSFRNDIALLELASPADVPVVALYGADVESIAGNSAFVAGWGAFEWLSVEEQRFDGVQRFAEVPLVSREVCNLPQSYNGTIESVKFCAGFATGGIDSCAGDSGGPLIVGVEADGELQQVQAGIVSYGNGCALADKYGVYTDVAEYRNWVGSYVSATFLPREVPADDPADGGSLLSGGSGGGGGAGSGLLVLLLLAARRLRRG